MATIVVDGRTHEADPSKNLLEVCLNLGYNLPYFCWHPALGSVGACRQCAVKQLAADSDTQGRVVMACMTGVAEGMRISIADAEASAFRKQVIEWLMESHPHDCPICDEGGECHLQDMTVMGRHTYREYRFPKQTFENQHLGPLINHEMNRCIECYRCVRYYRDYAGGRDLDVFAIGNRLYFGRQQDGTLENEFAGNLVEVCPTGVFTDKTLKQHYTRKWDLQMAPSVCVHCAAGCNITPGERYGILRRVTNRYNAHVNGFFICDRGRFGYEFVNSAQRVASPRILEGDTATTATPEDAVRTVAGWVQSAGRLAGVGSPRASLEANFALRELVGPDNFFGGVSGDQARLVATAIDALGEGPAPAASLIDLERADAVLVLGEDVTNTIPRWALALRQAALNQPRQQAAKAQIPAWHEAAVRELIQDERGPLFIASPAATRLDDVATATARLGAPAIAALGRAVAGLIEGNAAGEPSSDDLQDFARRAAAALAEAERPLVVSGTGAGSEEVIQAAAAVAAALHRHGRPATIALAVPEANSIGLALLTSQDLDTLRSRVDQAPADVVIVLENDLTARLGAERASALLARSGRVVAIDALESETTRRAAAVLPAGSFAESDGTLVNAEGRAQAFFQVMSPATAVQESWRSIRDVAVAAGRTDLAAWVSVDEVRTALAAEPAFSRVLEAAPSTAFRVGGRRIARQPARYSGRTAMLANVSVHEPKPPDDPDSPLAFSMEGTLEPPPPALRPFPWAPAWNSIQSSFKLQQEIGGELRGGDPGVRLIEPLTGGRGPDAPGPRREVDPAEGFVLTPLYHIFGSEELSRHAPAIVALTPPAYLALHPDDAATVGVAAGETVRIVAEGAGVALPVRIEPSLARGALGFPSGFAETQGLIAGRAARVVKA